jgi:LAS superfamily LD-carboxypeptidase LdcB
MTDEPQRRRPSGGGRHAARGRSRAPRPTIPVRPALRRGFPTSTVGRVAQGVLVVALAGALGGMAAQTSASADPRSGERLAARAAVTDAAVDALTVAQAARLTAQDVTVEGDQVAELEAATAELQDLLADAGVAEVSAPATASAADTTGTGTGSAASTASPDPEPTAATSAAEGLLSASGDGSLGVDDAPASSEPTSDATTEPTTEPTTDPSADATTDAADETTNGTANGTPNGTATVTGVDAISPEDVVVPPVTDAEDATTTRLRAALQRVVQLSDEVLDTAQEVADREAAAQAAEDERAAREAAEKAAVEKAEREAAEKAAEKAAQEAAERAAWKKSLAGYANGQIPSSALCATSFDSNVLLRCDATEDLEALDEGFYAEFGEHMTISDSYRSYAGQVSCRARKGSLCAVPGTSNHGTGTAIDLGGGAQGFGTAEWTWLKENSEDHGWEHPDWAAANGSKPEPWHWEYTR